MKDPKVLISVLTYENIPDTEETIRCFLNQDYKNFHLQVVDNASPSAVDTEIKKMFPEVEITRLQENGGYTKGNNWALERGLREGFDYVLISNHDIACDPNLLKNLVETAETKPDCGVVGIVETDFETGRVRTAGGGRYSFLTSRGKWHRNLSNNGSSNAMEVSFVQGSLVLFSHRTLAAGIRLDENLFMYGEEIDLSFQLRKKGLKSYIDTRCRVRHKSLPHRFSPFQGYLIQRNRLYLSGKYAARPTYLFSVLYMGLVEIPAKWLLRSLQGNFRYGWICLLGFLDALTGRLGYGRCQHLQ